jgi:hypothetical protein
MCGAIPLFPPYVFLVWFWMKGKITLQFRLTLCFILTLLLFVLGPPVCFPSELIWSCGSYSQLVRFLGWVISPVARLLPTQDNTSTEETHTDIHASSEILTHDPSVRASADISCLRPRGHSYRLTSYQNNKNDGLTKSVQSWRRKKAKLKIGAEFKPNAWKQFGN